MVQAQINAQQQMAALVSASQPGSVVSSPPPTVKNEDFSVLPGDPLQVTQRFIQENNITLFNKQSPNKLSQPQAPTSSSNLKGINFTRRPPIESEISGKWLNDSEVSPPLNYEPIVTEVVPGDVRSLQRHVLEIQNQLGRQSANSSFNKGSGSEKPITHSHSFSDSNQLRDEFPPTSVSLLKELLYTASFINVPSVLFCHVLNHIEFAIVTLF